jgi:hypothetical protein
MATAIATMPAMAKRSGDTGCEASGMAATLLIAATGATRFN